MVSISHGQHADHHAPRGRVRAREAGSIQYQAEDTTRLRIALDASTPTRHEVSSGILQAMKEGRGPSHAAKLLEQLDRDMLRALGFDSIALVVQI